MQPTLEELERRIVKCKEWMWMPGMRVAAEDGLMLSYRLSEDRHPSYPDEYDWPHDLGLRRPDLSDSATLGCLMNLIEQKHITIYGGPVEAVYLSPGIDTDRSVMWEVAIMFYSGLQHEISEGKSKAEALVIALEADIVTN